MFYRSCGGRSSRGHRRGNRDLAHNARRLSHNSNNPVHIYAVYKIYNYNATKQQLFINLLRITQKPHNTVIWPENIDVYTLNI